MGRESFKGNPQSPERTRIEKYGLLAGKKIAFEKIGMHSPSSVSVGTVIEGVLQDDLRVGASVAFHTGATMSDVTKIEELNEALLVHTRTSTYRLLSEKPAIIENFKVEDVAVVETARGSRYTYLPDGTTRRFKTVEGKEEDPQAVLVYVPDYAWVTQNGTPEVLKLLGENELIYTQILLEYVQNSHKRDQRVYIVDATGRKLETNKQISEVSGPVYLSFVKDGKTDFSIPVSHKPKIGYLTYDTRTYVDKETGKNMRERHLGNKVVKIVLKNGHIIE